MNSTDQACGSSSPHEGPPKGKSPERVEYGQTEVTPPSTLFAVTSQDDQSSEPFPDFVDLSHSSNHPTTGHCILHCDHEICLYTKNSDEENGRSPQECKCQSTPEIPEAVRSTPQIHITHDLLLHIGHVCGPSLSDSMEITIYLADTLDLLSQLKIRVEHYPVFLQLVEEIAYRLPGQQSVVVTGYSYFMFFHEVEKFFTRAIALHGQVSHQQWTISIGVLHREWRDCMYATMVEFIEMHFPEILGTQRVKPPGIAQYYIHEGVPKLVWDFWARTWADLVRILAWKYMQIARTEAETASPRPSRGRNMTA